MERELADVDARAWFVMGFLDEWNAPELVTESTTFPPALLESLAELATEWAAENAPVAPQWAYSAGIIGAQQLRRRMDAPDGVAEDW